ncbi:MAG TPA: HAMP domain-containing sensor histidine kinase [Steroidobacteraceae bacterium]|nr:HAMP domain-containing sensor histidine kinase [Steroidobacteraceae bacterium]
MSNSPLVASALTWRANQPPVWTAAWTTASVIAVSLCIACFAIFCIRRIRSLRSKLAEYASRTERAERENAQLQSTLLAAQRLEDWSRMSAAVTHEICNPLEAVQNILYLIRNSDAATPELVRLTRLASEEANRVLTISRSTLSFFRQSSTPELVDLRSAADSVRFLLDPLLRRREVTLKVSSSGDLTVHAFPGELRQVLLNLVRNAAEASPRGGSTVTVNLAGVADHVEITVRDEGYGIAPELLPTIFQFGHTTKGSHGNGMGLWTVKHIVDKHGGEIHIDSQPGQGAAFTITWPRHLPHAANGHRSKHLRPVNA